MSFVFARHQCCGFWVDKGGWTARVHHKWKRYVLKLQGDVESLSAAIGHGQDAIIIKVTLAVFAKRIAEFAVFGFIADYSIGLRVQGEIRVHNCGKVCFMDLDADFYCSSVVRERLL